MSEDRKDSPHGKGKYGDPMQRNILGGTELPGHISEASRMTGAGMFDSPHTEAISSEKPIAISPEVSTYFRGRELPTDVWAPAGVAYYERFEDIPTQGFREREAPPKIESYEARAAVALQVCPPMEGEPVDASFKFVGERGLYVRVIRGEKEVTEHGKVRKVPIIRWMHFNEEDADLKDVRYI